MISVSYASFCCPKDRDRALVNFQKHMDSHNFKFHNKIMVFQRCEPVNLPGVTRTRIIREDSYAEILKSVGIEYPNEVYSELTHGFGGPHFWAHHMVNHISALHSYGGDYADDYFVFADADCYVKDQPEGKSWIDEGIKILESNPDIFVVSPSDGRPNAERDRIMSQQMFLVNTKKMKEMEYIPWDGKFIDGGPFREFYALWEGFCYRYMKKNGLYRYLLGPEYRWWHLEWH